MSGRQADPNIRSERIWPQPKTATPIQNARDAPLRKMMPNGATRIIRNHRALAIETVVAVGFASIANTTPTQAKATSIMRVEKRMRLTSPPWTHRNGHQREGALICQDLQD
jgi:hypothetical protein